MAATSEISFQFQQQRYNSGYGRLEPAATWNYGFSVRFSGEVTKHYFLKQLERPNMTISCTLNYISPASASTDALSIVTTIQNTLANALSSSEISLITNERVSNSQLLEKYLNIDRLDLSPELQSKLSTLEQRNSEIDTALHASQQNSFHVSQRILIPDPQYIKSPCILKVPFIFDGFILKLVLTLSSLK